MPTPLPGTAERDCGGRASATRHEKSPVTGQDLVTPKMPVSPALSRTARRPSRKIKLDSHSGGREGTGVCPD